MSKMGELMNEVREILDLPAKDRGARIAPLLTELTQMGPEIMVMHKNVPFATGAYFATFCVLSMMCSSGKDVSEKSQLDMLYQVMGMVTTAIAKMEDDDGSEEKAGE